MLFMCYETNKSKAKQKCIFQAYINQNVKVEDMYTNKSIWKKKFQQL